jgi:hypothetical protein
MDSKLKKIIVDDVKASPFYQRCLKDSSLEEKSMSTPITFRFVSQPGQFGRKFTFKTLKGAQAKAYRLVGRHPKIDPDGYYVARNGNCLFTSGVTTEELFPEL